MKDELVPVLEAKFAALDDLFVSAMISRIQYPRTSSSYVGGTAGFELAIANASTSRPNDNALRTTGDVVESAICGDGAILGAEACDDGNLVDGDGCDTSCQIEPGHACSGGPSSCLSTCGDFVVDANETCDDGGQVNGDGCSDTCQLQDAYSFGGTAVGGSQVSLLVSGQLVVVATQPGQSAASIAQILANAINWSVPGVLAGAMVNQLYVTGAITQVVITDPGLSPAEVPVLGLLACTLLITSFGFAVLQPRKRR